MYKHPVSVLVVIHSQDGQVLLIERAAHPGLWQSVTGSLEIGESPIEAAWRELTEETGLTSADGTLTDHKKTTVYEIWPQWRHRYAPGVTQNTEHLFSFEMATPRSVSLAPNEHISQRWLPASHAAEICFSPSNSEAILAISQSL